MSVKRINNFIGDNYTYARYLLEVLTRTLPNCILLLEDQVNKIYYSSDLSYSRVVLEFSPSITL
jgi:hypothetical protein